MSRPPPAKSDLLFLCLFVFLQGTFVFISFLRNCIWYNLQALKSDWLFCSILVACKKVRLRASELRTRELKNEVNTGIYFGFRYDQHLAVGEEREENRLRFSGVISFVENYLQNISSNIWSFSDKEQNKLTFEVRAVT